jgi:hypothetical protein
MKTNFSQTLAAVIAVASLSAISSPALAQDSSTGITLAQTEASTTVAAPAPQLAYGVAQILELQQAKVDDTTIIAYIHNSGNSYGLNADQIIYLRQQGLSSAVLNAMLSQPTPGVLPANSVPQPSGPAPQVAYTQPYSQPAPVNNGIVGPSVSGIDPSAAAAAAGYYAYPPAYGYSYPVAYTYSYPYPAYYSYPYHSCYYPAYCGAHYYGYGCGVHYASPCGVGYACGAHYYGSAYACGVHYGAACGVVSHGGYAGGGFHGGHH